jgi:hypothetical protein
MVHEKLLFGGYEKLSRVLKSCRGVSGKPSRGCEKLSRGFEKLSPGF